MINYDYLQYWLETINNIKLTQISMYINLNEYIKTQNEEYLEYMTNCIEELRRLNKLKIETYSQAFT